MAKKTAAKTSGKKKAPRRASGAAADDGAADKVEELTEALEQAQAERDEAYRYFSWWGHYESREAQALTCGGLGVINCTQCQGVCVQETSGIAMVTHTTYIALIILGFCALCWRFSTVSPRLTLGFGLLAVDGVLGPRTLAAWRAGLSCSRSCFVSSIQLWLIGCASCRAGWPVS